MGERRTVTGRACKCLYFANLGMLVVHSKQRKELEEKYRGIKVGLEQKLKHLSVSLSILQPKSTSIVLMSHLASSHIPGICKQQALEIEQEISASKVLHVGALVSKGKTSKQLSQLVI